MNLLDVQRGVRTKSAARASGILDVTATVLDKTNDVYRRIIAIAS